MVLTGRGKKAFIPPLPGSQVSLCHWQASPHPKPFSVSHKSKRQWYFFPQVQHLQFSPSLKKFPVLPPAQPRSNVLSMTSTFLIVMLTSTTQLLNVGQVPWLLWASAGMTPLPLHKGNLLHNNDNCFSMHLCNCETFESGLVYTRCKSGRKKLITCGSVYLITPNPGLAISLLYFCFLFLNKPAVKKCKKAEYKTGLKWLLAAHNDLNDLLRALFSCPNKSQEIQN